jgi:NADH-quinone oxidoreductase subunit M
MSGLAAYGIVRLVLPIKGVMDTNFLFTLMWGLITIIYGGMMVLAQTDIKKLLAYSSMSQLGYIFVGIASCSTIGVSGAMLHYVSHGLGKAVLFLSIGAIINQTGIRDIRQLGGLAQKMPITALTFLIGALNLAGIPPTVGFVSKVMIFLGIFNSGVNMMTTEFMVGLAALISTILTIGYTLWAMRRIFYGPLPEHLKNVKEPPYLMTIPLVLLCLLSLLLGLYPSVILDPLLKSVAALLA